MNRYIYVPILPDISPSIPYDTNYPLPRKLILKREGRVVHIGEEGCVTPRITVNIGTLIDALMELETQRV